MKLTKYDKDLGYCEEAQTYCSVAEDRYKEGISDEYNRVIGFLKYNQYAIVDNNGDYYSIEELEKMLGEQK